MVSIIVMAGPISMPAMIDSASASLEKLAPTTQASGRFDSSRRRAEAATSPAPTPPSTEMLLSSGFFSLWTMSFSCSLADTRVPAATSLIPCAS